MQILQSWTGDQHGLAGNNMTWESSEPIRSPTVEPTTRHMPG